MRFRWPEDTVFHRLVLDVEQDCCQTCGADLHICDHRIRRIYTLEHPLKLCCRLVHCSDPACPSRPRTLSPASELTLALPGWLIAWDVFCLIGHRRFARHWSIPQIRNELSDAYSIRLSPDSLSNYIHHYQNMLAARQQDSANLQAAYRNIDALDLTIDGLQPEKGHETLYAVRELRGKRVWFAQALLSSTDAEVQQLLARAGAIAKQLGKPIRLWMSDKQDAFVKGIAAQFPGVPHLYCGNHFLRNLARPTLEADSTAKVRMRKKVRGLRDIERSVLQQRQPASAAGTPSPPPSTTTSVPAPAPAPATSEPEPAATEPEVMPSVTAESQRSGEECKTGPDGEQARQLSVSEPPGDALPASSSNGLSTTATDMAVLPGPSEGSNGQGNSSVETAAERGDGRTSGVVLDYCAAVRGILNDDQGGPLDPPGLRMAEALTEVRESLQRCLDRNQPGPAHEQLQRLAGCIDAGLEDVKTEQQAVQEQGKAIQRVAETLAPESGTLEQRKERYEQLQEEYRQKGGEFYDGLVKVMLAWSIGLFVKVEGEPVPVDNQELERWFRNPKDHERRIHGHKHAGVRIVQEGPTLLLALDAHLEHDGPFTAEELLPYRHAQAPQDQQEAINRRKVMRKARSKKNDAPCSET